MTRIGVTGFEIGVVDVGSSYIRRAMEAVKIIRYLLEGVVHSAVIDSVSCNGMRKVGKVEYDEYGTPAKRQISAPLWRSVRRACSPTQVTSQGLFCVIETGPPVYRGAMVRAFLKLRMMMPVDRIRIDKRIWGTYALLLFGLWLFEFITSERGDGKNGNGRM
jgi:hypothetical protein